MHISCVSSASTLKPSDVLRSARLLCARLHTRWGTSFVHTINSVESLCHHKLWNVVLFLPGPFAQAARRDRPVSFILGPSRSNKSSRRRRQAIGQATPICGVRVTEHRPRALGHFRAHRGESRHDWRCRTPGGDRSGDRGKVNRAMNPHDCEAHQETTVFCE